MQCLGIVWRDRGYGCGGDLPVYIHNSMQFECLGHSDTSPPESINIRVKPKCTECFTVSFIYRPPNSKSEWTNQMYEYLDRVFFSENMIALKPNSYTVEVQIINYKLVTVILGILAHTLHYSNNDEQRE